MIQAYVSLSYLNPLGEPYKYPFMRLGFPNGCCFEELFMFLKTKNTKTCLIEEVVFVFLAPRILKMTLFRKQKKCCFSPFFIV